MPHFFVKTSVSVGDEGELLKTTFSIEVTLTPTLGSVIINQLNLPNQGAFDDYKEKDLEILIGWWLAHVKNQEHQANQLSACLEAVLMAIKIKQYE